MYPTAHLQLHNLSEVAFRQSDSRHFLGYVIAIGAALTVVVATCFYTTTYASHRNTAEISRAV